MIKATLIFALLVLSAQCKISFDHTITREVEKQYQQVGPDAMDFGYHFPTSPMTNCMAAIIHDFSQENSDDLCQRLDIQVTLDKYKNEEMMDGKCKMLVLYGHYFIRFGPIKGSIEGARSKFQKEAPNMCKKCMNATRRVRRLALLKKDLKKLGY